MPTQRFIVVPGCLAASTAGLAFFFPWMGGVCLALVVLAVLGLTLAALVFSLFGLARLCGLSRRPGPRKPIWVCLTVGLMGLAGLIVANLWMAPALPPHPLEPSAELAYLLRTDQEDRFAVRLFSLIERDRQRLARVLDFQERGVIVTPHDCFAAALVLQHGAAPEHYQLAHELAKAARDGGIEGADWLVKATYDRWMISTGQPQVYGTQSTVTFGFKKE